MQELAIMLEPRSKEPLYLQIYTFIRGEAEAGRIYQGEKLPSARALAAQLGVSRSTIDMAYAQLVAEGYLEARPNRGYFISSLEELNRSGPPMRETYEPPEPETSLPYDFSLGGIAPGGFPYNIWRKLSREVLAGDDGNLFQLGEPQGDWGLREAIASYLYHGRGVNCSPQQILVGAGNDYLLMLLSVIFPPGIRIAMENPTYISAYRTFRNLRFPVESVPMDNQGIQVEALEQCGAQVAYVMPSHQFPMGTVMPIGRRMQLLAWAESQEDRYLIEDDYDSEFRYRGRPVPALLGADRAGKVIYLGTFSRSVAPAIRISYMVLPQSLMDRYKKLPKIFSATVSRADQKIMELFLREGYYQRHLNRMRTCYKGKHDLLLAGLKQIPAVERIWGEHAGTHLAVSLKGEDPEAERIRQARDQGVQVYGLSEYLVGGKKEKDSPTILLGYASLEEKKLPEAVERLKKAWE